MLTVLMVPLAVVLVLAFMQALARFERWSKACEERDARTRAEEALIMGHPGATDEWAERLVEWRETDAAWREYGS